MVITAKFPGRCSKCGGKIEIGSAIDWERGQGASHVKCPTAKPAAPAVPAYDGKTWNVGGGEGDGYSAYHEGQIVHAKGYEIKRGYPEWLYVLSASKRYYREDGMSFGVGDESGYVFSAVCREATPEEAAPYIAKSEASKVAQTRALELERIKRAFVELGERPTLTSAPEGQKFLDTGNIYGGGDWFIVGTDEVWYIRGNGADGDDWSQSNALVGIGWRLARESEVVAKLLALLAA
jgi:hypothetical protein